MTLRESLQSEFATVFADAAAFGETVTYLPARGGSRSIVAIVDRDPSSSLVSAAAGLSLPELTIEVANSATSGIASTEVDTGGDAVLMAKREGGAVERLRIVRIVGHDVGALTLEVR